MAGILSLLLTASPLLAAQADKIPFTGELSRLVPEFILESHFPGPREEIRGVIAWAWTPEGEEIQARSREASATGQLPAYLVEIIITPADSSPREPWRLRLPFSAGRMPPFAIPAGTFLPGIHRLTAQLIDPAGETHPFLVSPPQALSVLEPRADVLTGSCVDAPVLLTRGVKQGTPSREIYPANDARDTFSRTPWDMHRFGDAIYVGSGDWQRNTGPAPIWTIRLDATGKTVMNADYVIYGESVQRFRTVGDRLLVPDIDPRDSWDFGNLYISENGRWTKKRTLPNAIHAFDAIGWRERLYVTTGTNTGARLLVSEDGGDTWGKVAGDDAAMTRAYRFHQMCPVGDSLLVMGASAASGAWILSPSGRFEPRTLELFPRLRTLNRITARRLEPFAKGALYTVSWDSLFADGRGQPQKRPLFFLPAAGQSALLVEPFKDAHVMDIVIDGDDCLVLTIAAEGVKFRGEIFSSRDLRSWTRLASFPAEAPPFSFERLNGTFFVGLGPRSFEDIEPESGTLLRLEP